VTRDSMNHKNTRSKWGGWRHEPKRVGAKTVGKKSGQEVLQRRDITRVWAGTKRCGGDNVKQQSGIGRASARGITGGGRRGGGVTWIARLRYEKIRGAEC